MDFAATEEELKQVAACCGGDLTVPRNFAVTAPPHAPGDPHCDLCEPFRESPQTTRLVQTFGLGLDFRTQHGVTGKRRRPLAAWPVFEASSQPDAAAGLLDGVTRVGGDEEIDLGDD